MKKIVLDKEIEVSTEPSLRYILVGYHHSTNPSKNKSIWTVNADKEIDLFIEACKNNYVDNIGKYGFNFDVSSNGRVNKLGRDINTKDLYVGKFDIGVRHGYPANHMLQKDRPSEEILEAINAQKAISPRELKCLKQAKRLK
jgi:hypothetical protein